MMSVVVAGTCGISCQKSKRSLVVAVAVGYRSSP